MTPCMRNIHVIDFMLAPCGDRYINECSFLQQLPDYLINQTYIAQNKAKGGGILDVM